MGGLFSSENSKVIIYLDDGTGSPSGNALWTGRFVNTLALSMGATHETIPHAGYPNLEHRLGVTNYSLQFEKAVESSGRDLRLTNALYCIDIEVWTDDRSEWVIYRCGKCVRISWDLNRPASGAYVARASFVAEQINPVSPS
jgi:hypothetical protein